MIKIIAVGKVKERFYTEAIAEYSKRLGAYTGLQIVQVQDEKTPDGCSSAIAEQIKNKEGERILAAISEKDFVITLDIKGTMMSSEVFSEYIDRLRTGGHSDICFVIGGSLGLCAAVSARADKKISFSEMTFPHQLMRVILLEQIYRAFKIMKNEPYHK